MLTFTSSLGRWAWVWKGFLLVLGGVAGGLGLVVGYLLYSGFVVLARLGLLSYDVLRYLARVLTFGLLALMVTCRTWEPAGPDRKPIEVYTEYQVEGGLTLQRGELYFETTTGDGYVARDGTTCVIEEGTVRPAGTDERPEDDK